MKKNEALRKVKTQKKGHTMDRLFAALNHSTDRLHYQAGQRMNMIRFFVGTSISLFGAGGFLYINIAEHSKSKVNFLSYLTIAILGGGATFIFSKFDLREREMIGTCFDSIKEIEGKISTELSLENFNLAEKSDHDKNAEKSSDEKRDRKAIPYRVILDITYRIIIVFWIIYLIYSSYRFFC